ncbi:MAG TPA: B12-binding domain-containing protein [Actinomycetota bacterium]|nr:B12-binding domain-containing protein [Actinomycetota bacterium]
MDLVTGTGRIDDRLDPDTRLTIAAVSELLDIPIPTIRSWERRYGFPAPARTQGKHRRYSVGEADQLRMLRDEIARGHATREAVDIVRRSTASAGPRHELLDRFLRSAMKLDPAALRQTLNDAVDALGPDLAIRDVALPAMREMGSRWKAGVCDTAHEHLATEAVRVWLARQSVMAPAPFRPYPLVLACGPKDLHTIGLEAFGVVLGRRGWSLRTLGPLTPVDSLVAAVRAAEARGAVITSQRSVARRAAVDAIAAVDALPGVHAFYAGMAFAPAAGRKDVPGVWLGDDILDAATILDEVLPLG